MTTVQSCEKCQGAGVRSAEMRSFDHDGQGGHYLAFYSSCGVCGHRWEDAIHEANNSMNAEQARRAMSCQR